MRRIWIVFAPLTASVEYGNLLHNRRAEWDDGHLRISSGSQAHSQEGRTWHKLPQASLLYGHSEKSRLNCHAKLSRSVLEWSKDRSKNS